VSIAIHPEAVVAPPSIQSAVSRLGAGFQHMQALGAELTTLDAVNQDIRHTQSMIRLDVANTVLQTAFSVKTCRDAVTDPGETKTTSDTAKTSTDAYVPDQWSKRLLRWADRLGRDLFGFSNAGQRTASEDRTLLPPQKR